MIKHILFDFDDTLVHTWKLAHKKHSLTAKSLDLRIPSKEEFYTHWGKPWKKALLSYWPDLNFRKFRINHMKIHYADGSKLGYSKPITGMQKTLLDLRKMGFKLYILTSRDRISLIKNLDYNGIMPLFSGLHSMNDSIYHKPDPRVFTAAFKRFKIKKEEALFVGDLPIDCIGALNAGVVFVGVKTGFGNGKSFLKLGLPRTNIIKDVSHLPSWIKTHGGHL